MNLLPPALEPHVQPGTHGHFAVLAQRYRSEHARLCAQWLHSRAVRTPALLGQLAALADAQVLAVAHAVHLPHTVAVLAVGGYGRAQLFPHSDVDVLVLLPPIQTETTQPEAAAAEAFVRALWDAGLDLSARVLTQQHALQRCAQELDTQTSLLEMRQLWGDAAVGEQLRQQFDRQFDAERFFQAKLHEMQQRHARQGATPYALEPHCKDAPGGLRDVHTLGWLARCVGLRSVEEILTPWEARQLQRHSAQLAQLRARVHVLAQRRQDRIVFDLQAALAAQECAWPRTGHCGVLGQVQPQRLADAAQRLMRRYYWAAKGVSQIVRIALPLLAERLPSHAPSAAKHALSTRTSMAAGDTFAHIDTHWRIGPGALLQMDAPHLLEHHPQAILRVFEWLQALRPHVRGLGASVLRALYQSRHVMDAHFRRDAVNVRTFARLLRQPGADVAQTLSLMNECSVLGRYVWAFRRTVGRVQHDGFHAYTVDQHSLEAVRCMQLFFGVGTQEKYFQNISALPEMEIYRDIAAQWEKPWLLYMAAFFHDIGKGHGGDHSQTGAIQAKRFARQHGWEKSDAHLIEFLVREHLLMSHFAQKRDVGDMAVVADFAQRVGHIKNLQALYLLTVADIAATHPRLFTPFKARLLQQLYQRCIEFWQAKPAQDNLPAIQARAMRLLQRWHQHKQPKPRTGHWGILGQVQALESVWRSLPASYFYRHSIQDVVWHAHTMMEGGLLHAMQTPKTHSLPPVVSWRQRGASVQLLVLAPDCPDVFARICGALARAEWLIVQASIHTSTLGWVVDSFELLPHTQCADAQMIAHLGRMAAATVRALPAALQPDAPWPQPPSTRRSAHGRSFPLQPSVRLSPEELSHGASIHAAQSPQAKPLSAHSRWLLDIAAADRPALLYRIARVLAAHGADVQLAKVMTLGERVEDSFVLRAPQLVDGERRAALERDLLAVL